MKCRRLSRNLSNRRRAETGIQANAAAVGAGVVAAAAATALRQ